MQHLTKMILDRAEKFNNREALFYKESNTWQGITWKEMAEQIKAVSMAILECGLKSRKYNFQ